MLGPVTGGMLYSLPANKADAFRLPFLVCGAIPLAMLPFVHAAIPQEHLSGEEVHISGEEVHTCGGETDGEASPAEMRSSAGRSTEMGAPARTAEMRLPLTASIAIQLVSIGLSGTIVGTLDPTLGWRSDHMHMHMYMYVYMLMPATHPSQPAPRWQQPGPRC